jgi:hypothetical protein
VNVPSMQKKSFFFLLSCQQLMAIAHQYFINQIQMHI